MNAAQNGARLADALRQAKQKTTSSFPLEALPSWLRSHVESVANRLQTSEDMPAAFAFAVLSAAVGPVVVVRAWEGFEQPCVVWTVIAAASGENKSAVVNAMKSPVVNYERKRIADEKPAYEEGCRRYQILKTRAEAMVKKTANARAENPIELVLEEADAALKAANDAIPKALFRMSLDSATTEAAVKLLAEHCFMAHLEAEGDVFLDIVGRYTNGGLLKQYLDAFDGEGINIDRVGRGHISATRVLLVLGIMTQPAMLTNVMAEKNFKGRGFLERCLYAMPKTLVGKRQVGKIEANHQTEAFYAQKLHGLCEYHHTVGRELRVLDLSNEAVDVFVAYRQRIEKRMTTDLASIVSWTNKSYGGFALRIGGLLAIAWDSEATEVTAEVMEHAVKVMEAFFIPQALLTFGDLRGNASGHVYRQLESWLRRQKGVFTSRDLQKARGDLCPTADEARQKLEALVEEGLIEHAERPRTHKSGPPPALGYRFVRQDRQNPRQNATQQNHETNSESAHQDDVSDSSDVSDESAENSEETAP